MKTRLLLLALLVPVMAAWSADIAPPFSSLVPGQTLPKEFRIVALPKIAPNSFSLVADGGTSVLRVDSSNSAGSLNLALTARPATGGARGAPLILDWRWKVSRVLEKADMADKMSDDHAARLYVFFDMPIETLSFVERNKIKIARALSGLDVPTAALCYVWDNKHRVGYKTWSPYTNRMRKIVLQSGPQFVGQWMSEARDVAADFREAFGVDAPAVIGIAIGNDSDNTDERVTTWFGDISFRQ
ncbi:MAG: DUF3047 domain-containing protein [Rhodoferax sp.]